MSNNLNFQTLTTSQTNKEAGVNTALGQVDAVISDLIEYESETGAVDITPTAAEATRYRVYRVSINGASPPTTAEAIDFITTNFGEREFVVHNNTGRAVTIDGGPFWVAPGASRQFHYDGTVLVPLDKDTQADFVHPAITAASTANVDETATGSGDSFDGVTLAVGDIILLKDQTDATENGIYLVGSTALTRAPWLDTGDTMVAGLTVPVLTGTANAGKHFKVVEDAVLDTDNAVFAAVAAPRVTIGVFLPGSIAGATTVWQFVVTDPMLLQASLTGSQAFAGTAPSGGAASFSIIKNGGASSGTVNFADGVATGTFTFASDLSFVAGDRLSFVTGGSMNGIANVSITLKGVLKG
jgi:hypothetical protein